MLIKVTNGVPESYSLAALRRDEAVSFPPDISDEALLEYDVHRVQPTPPPDYDPLREILEAKAPLLQDGVWTQQWVVTSLSDVQILENLHREINAERERRLTQGSSFSVPDTTDPIPLTGRPFDQTVYLALLTRAAGYKAAGVTAPILKIRDGVDQIHMLTADQMTALISQSMTWFESVMATSWAMKDGMAPFEAGIPADFADDRHWPT